MNSLSARLKRLESLCNTKNVGLIIKTENGWTALYKGIERYFKSLDAAEKYLKDLVDVLIIDDI